MSRSMERSMLKKRYERFCEAWANEKRYQKYVLETGEKLPEGIQQLGRKPTFNMWLQAVKAKKIAADVTQPAQPAVAEKKVEVKDEAWEE